MNNVNVSTSLLDPYGSFIRQFIIGNFPEVTIKSSAELLETLTEAIVATGSVRLGGRPSPESLVKIREVITHYTAKQLPIPFMVPWGSEKPDGSSIDIAELGALKTLFCLQDRITRSYLPGAVFNIRLEDASAPHLFYERADQARVEAQRYTKDFVNLVKVLGFSFVVPKPESAMVSEVEFNAQADRILPLMLDHLKSRTVCKDDAKAQSTNALLMTLGWSSWIADSAIQFYLEQYSKLMPDTPIGERIHVLARYYSAALARGILKIRGDEPSWNGKFIDLAFVAPAPGAEGANPRRVLYRTFPSQLTSHHMPPWRAKGYLAIQNDGETRPRLASFNDKTLLLNENSVKLTSNGIEVEVKSDYLIEDGYVSQPIPRRLSVR